VAVVSSDARWETHRLALRAAQRLHPGWGVRRQ
jgi:hypothetical protein